MYEIIRYSRVLHTSSTVPTPSTTTTTWNPADKGPNLVLDATNLIITAANTSDNDVRSVASAASGKKYWRVTVGNVVAPASTTLGFANGLMGLTSYIGVDNNSIGWAGDGNLYRSSGVVGAFAAWTTGDVLSFAIDVDAELFWGKVNSGNWNNNPAADPSTGANGFDFSATAAGPWFAAAMVHNVADTFTGDFSSTGAPSGFGIL